MFVSQNSPIKKFLSTWFVGVVVLIGANHAAADGPNAQQLRALIRDATATPITYQVTVEGNQTYARGGWEGILKTAQVLLADDRYRIVETHPMLAQLREGETVIQFALGSNELACRIADDPLVIQHIADSRAALIESEHVESQLRSHKAELIQYHMYGDGETLLPDLLEQYAGSIGTDRDGDDVRIAYVDEEGTRHIWTLDAGRRYVVTHYEKFRENRRVFDKRTTYGQSDGVLHPLRSREELFMGDDGSPLRYRSNKFHRVRRAKVVSPKDFNIAALDRKGVIAVTRIEPGKPNINLEVHEGVVTEPTPVQVRVAKERAEESERAKRDYSDAPTRRLKSVRSWRFGLAGMGLVMGVVAVVLLIKRIRR